MAINKRKALNAARKFAQKGAKEKALKEYNALLKADPRDAKLRLEVGDAYRRWGQLKDATTQYERVADQYKEEGFDARAVAVLKQILNLDPKRYVALVSLSDLYQRIGLESEAIGALQAAADGYREEGDTREALELLRKMGELDPGNTTSRIKVAALLGAEGMRDDAVAEYEAVVQELRRVGDGDSIPRIYERILELCPERTDLLATLARELLTQGDGAGAEAYARRACEADPADTDALELLGQVYQDAGRAEELAETTRKLAELYRERGDEQHARETMQRLPTAALDLEPLDSELGPSPEEFEADHTSALSADDSSMDGGAQDDLLMGDDDLADEDLMGGAFAGDDELIGEDELLGDEEYLEGPNTDFDLGDGTPKDELVVESDASSAAPLATPSGDPDQLLAEASVYLRYGKREQARASLDAALAQEPEHRGVLEKLGEVLAEDGQSAEAVNAWARSARLALEAGDTDGFKVVRDRMAAIDPAAAAALPDPTETARPDEVDEPGDSPEDSEHAIEFELDVDMDIEFDDGADASHDADSDEDTGQMSAEGAEALLEAGGDGQASETEVDLRGSDGDEFRDIAEDSIGADSTSEADPHSGTSLSATESQQISEDLEEAEFYFQQDLYDEAEAIYQRVLASAPNHPSAMVRLGELAAARGDDPSAMYQAPDVADSADASASFGSPDAVASESQAEGFEIEIDGFDETEVEEFSAGSDDLSAAVEELSLGEDENVSFEGDSFEERTQPDGEVSGAEESAAASASSTELGEPSESSDAMELSEESVIEVDLDLDESGSVDEDEASSVDVACESDANASSAIADETFDLAAELRDAIEGDDAEGDDSGESGEVRSTVQDGFSSIFSEFKQGVSQTLSEGDHETRYDLGIAYREMGLLDDAIGEFRICLESPSRRIDSLHMLSLCALDADRASEAVALLEQALASPDVEQERRSGLYFDLGRAFEQVADLSRARASYEAIETPGYPGVADRLAALEEAESQAVASDDEAVVEVEELEEEQFESFDDMVAEVEALDAVRKAAAPEETPEEQSGATDRPGPVASGDPEEVAPNDKSEKSEKTKKTKKSKKPPRKRKISFV